MKLVSLDFRVNCTSERRSRSIKRTTLRKEGSRSLVKRQENATEGSGSLPGTKAEESSGREACLVDLNERRQKKRHPEGCLLKPFLSARRDHVQKWRAWVSKIRTCLVGSSNEPC
jgi:hypothetical protein